MKGTILLITLIMTCVTNAARICKTYIPDQWPDSRYTVEGVSADNVVTDNKTALMWKQCSEGLSGADCMIGTVTTHTWQQALALADAQNIHGFAGYTDWRVPNQKELRTLVARKCHNPSINENVFPNTPPNKFWSSSPVSNDFENGVWIVNFIRGDDSNSGRNFNDRVRLVRTTQ